jgi:glycosyltransferase involved in cell wall biosynthesis
MVQVTHLLDGAADEQVRHIHSMLIRNLGEAFVSRTATIGPGADCRGIPGAVALLRREKPDVTLAWGLKPLASAVLAHRHRIFFSPARFAGPRALGWIRPIMNRADVTMVCTSATQGRLAISHGIDPNRCVMLPPGVDMESMPKGRDEALRRELGFTENDFVIIAPGESTLLSGHDHAAWATLILHVLDPSRKLLVWGRGPKAAGLPGLSGRLKLNLVTLAEPKLGRTIPFEHLLGAADVCLATPVGMAPTLPVAMAMAAGVPIVALKNSAISQLVEDGLSALLVPSCSPRMLVQRVMDLQADAGPRDRIVARARAVAAERFSEGGMTAAYRDLLAGERLGKRSTFNAQRSTFK